MQKPIRLHIAYHRNLLENSPSQISAWILQSLRLPTFLFVVQQISVSVSIRHQGWYRFSEEHTKRLSLSCLPCCFNVPILVFIAASCAGNAPFGELHSATVSSFSLTDNSEESIHVCWDKLSGTGTTKGCFLAIVFQNIFCHSCFSLDLTEGTIMYVILKKAFQEDAMEEEPSQTQR